MRGTFWVSFRIPYSRQWRKALDFYIAEITSFDGVVVEETAINTEGIGCKISAPILTMAKYINSEYMPYTVYEVYPLELEDQT